jgi:uncharacterized protein (DUF433 family)
MKKRILLTVGLSVMLALLVVGTVLAQGNQPPITPNAPGKALKDGLLFRPFGPFGGWQVYDAVAAALKLTPTQLFEQLHSGKTLQEIAAAQKVEMSAIQDAIKAARQSKAREAIQKAQEQGKITKDRAEWMLKGLENGWNKPMLPGRRGR